MDESYSLHAQKDRNKWKLPALIVGGLFILAIIVGSCFGGDPEDAGASTEPSDAECLQDLECIGGNQEWWLEA